MVLVITVIVLLVLAGVVINLSMGENGIIGKAQVSVDKYKQAAQNEQVQLAKYENEIEGYISSIRDYELEISRLKDEIQALKSANSYSNEEKVVGTWTDGKVIYQKTFKITNVPTTKDTWVYTPIGINDIDVLVDLTINWYDTVDNCFWTIGRIREWIYFSFSFCQWRNLEIRLKFHL